MLSMQNAYFGYPAPEDAPEGTPPTVIVQNVSKSVLAGQRIGILGANGQGKSTLVKTVARALAPISGDMTEGKGLNIGYFAQQELDVLRLGDNPLEHMIRLVKEVSAAGKLGNQPTREQDLRSFLGNFNFGGDMVKQAVGSMSGGEKARLVLCMIVWQRPNLLLLDEPTNHLDLATREALSMALNEFEGTVMLVSHDRALLRAVCDEFWMVSRGGVEPFDGDLDDYQRYLLDEAKRLREEAKKTNSSAAPVATKTVAASADAASVAGPSNTSASKGGADSHKNSSKKEDAQRRQQQSEATKPLRKELEKIDQKMQSLGTEQASLQTLLTTTSVAAEIAQTGKRLKAIENELGTLEERWLALTEQIEVATV
jgi:ATP-binding cassette subfamily F protein 3